jgi:hypothetical protein
MHVNQAANLPTLKVDVGTIRFWDNGTDWMSLCPTSASTCNWATLDKYLEYASSHRLDVIYTFGRVPVWENPSGPSYQHVWATNVADIADWKNFVSAIVQHSAGRIKYWEIWNEPNVGGFWSGTNAQLIALAESAYKIIKAADPCSQVLLPPTSDPDWTNTYLDDGGGQYADIMTFHGYPSGAPEHYVPMITAFRSVFASHGYSGRPVWDTEGNWVGGQPSYFRSADEDAAWVARSLVLQASMGVQRFAWYGWDFCNDTPCYANLWTRTTGIRAPGQAYRITQQWLLNSFVGTCSNLRATVWSCPVYAAGYRGQILWDTGNKPSSYIVSPEFVQVRSIFTNTIKPIRSHTVVLGHKPILIQSRTSFSGPGQLPARP